MDLLDDKAPIDVKPIDLDAFMSEAPDTSTTTGAGRPTKLSPAVQSRICDALRAGNTRKAAAEYGGVTESTFYNWLERGRNPRMTKKNRVFKADKGFLEFLESVTRAENEAQVRNVAVLQKAAQGWPVKKTTTRTEKKIIGKVEIENPNKGKKNQPDTILSPVFATETTTTVVEYTEYDWRAALEWLQRRYPKDWGLRVRVEQILEEELNDALNTLQQRLSPGDYQKVLEALAA